MTFMFEKTFRIIIIISLTNLSLSPETQSCHIKVIELKLDFYLIFNPIPLEQWSPNYGPGALCLVLSGPWSTILVTDTNNRV